MNEKLYKKPWFWLMLTTVILLMRLLLYIIKYCMIKDIFLNECFWTAIGSLGTLFSVIIAAISIVSSEKNRKKQATYDAFDKFKISIYEKEIEIEKYKMEEIIKEHEDNDDKKWNVVKEYLIGIERIATCVNNEVFDCETVYNMGGPYLINQYNRLSPIIEYKRNIEHRKVYDEFEEMVITLKKIKNKKTEEK